MNPQSGDAEARREARREAREAARAQRTTGNPFAFLALMCGVASWVPLIVVITGPLTFAFFALAHLADRHRELRGRLGAAWAGLTLVVISLVVQVGFALAIGAPFWAIGVLRDVVAARDGGSSEQVSGSLASPIELSRVRPLLFVDGAPTLYVDEAPYFDHRALAGLSIPGEWRSEHRCEGESIALDDAVALELAVGDSVVLVGESGACVAAVGELRLLCRSGCTPTASMVAPLTGCEGQVAPVALPQGTPTDGLVWRPGRSEIERGSTPLLRIEFEDETLRLWDPDAPPDAPPAFEVGTRFEDPRVRRAESRGLDDPCEALEHAHEH